MSNLKQLGQLEQSALSLPPGERERLVLAMWDSLDGVPAVDPEWVGIALVRDAEVDSGRVQPISHAELRRRTQSDG